MFVRMESTGYSTTEKWELWHPNTGPSGTRGVLRMHGRSATALVGKGAATQQRQALVDRGLSVFASDYGSSIHWANATALARAATARTLIQGTYGVSSGGVLLNGESMGSLLALLYTLANPTHVKAVAIALPLVNLLGFYSENRSGFAAEISTARGGAPTSAADPQSRAAEYAALGIPTKLWASSNDTLCPLSEAQAFSTAIGAGTVVNMGAQGHAVGPNFAAEAADFLAANA